MHKKKEEKKKELIEIYEPIISSISLLQLVFIELSISIRVPCRVSKYNNKHTSG